MNTEKAGPGKIFVQESWINRTEGYSCGDSGVYETRDNIGEEGNLYRSMVKEHGRCISRVYIDGPNGEAKPIGWVFLKRRKYEDTEETYLAETWVTLHNGKEKRTVEYDYRELNA